MRLQNGRRLDRRRQAGRTCRSRPGQGQGHNRLLGSGLDGDYRRATASFSIHLRYLEGKLAALDRYLLAAMQPYAWAWRLLQTIPGIDAVSAAMILIEIGDDPHRFGSPARLASWSALCPGNNESAE